MKTKNKKTIDLKPFMSFFAFWLAFFSGRVRFPGSRVGTVVELDDGLWQVFREIVIDPPGKKVTPLPVDRVDLPGAIFRPRFHIKGMSRRFNEVFSWLPIPFFAGLPGFRRKLWLVDQESGDFSGYYEWQTTEDADNYAQSFAMRFMTTRSVPGSVSARIIPCDALSRFPESD